ncbi:hypothetical protein F5883DRAFT_107950 [Diaporthe sp. PMI_573]|nr:hypothetical protein F5883DRAFT_107950 [Diaporthaceae sp. PMI_573]
MRPGPVATNENVLFPLLLIITIRQPCFLPLNNMARSLPRGCGCAPAPTSARPQARASAALSSQLCQHQIWVCGPRTPTTPWHVPGFRVGGVEKMPCECSERHFWARDIRVNASMLQLCRPGEESSFTGCVLVSCVLASHATGRGDGVALFPPSLPPSRPIPRGQQSCRYFEKKSRRECNAPCPSPAQMQVAQYSSRGGEGRGGGSEGREYQYWFRDVGSRSRSSRQK